MKRKTKIFATTLVCMLVCIVLALAGMKVYADSKSHGIPEGVYVDTVSLGGKTAQEARELVDEYIKNLAKKKFTLVVDEHSVKTTLEEIGFTCTDNNYIEEASNLGKSGNLIKRYKELKDIENKKRVYNLEFTIDDKKATKFMKTKCKKYEAEPVDAVLTRKNGVFHIQSEVLGRTIHFDDTIEKIKAKLADHWDMQDVRIEAVSADAIPEVTKVELEKVKDVLGEYQTTYASSSANRAANLDNAARLINGTVLMPGEEFSTSSALTPFTEDNGYHQAGAYLNGKVVDSVGGGVCQAATTLYNALLKAELEITERYNHSMIVTYVEPSMDAAISDGYKDLKFKNSTDAPIYIEGYTAGRTIYFKVYGAETRDTVNRSVKYVSETTQTIQPGADKVTKDPAMPTSYRVVKQAAHVGYKARLWKYVYENGKEVSKEQVNYSSYAAEPAYVIVGTKEEKKDEKEDKDKDKDKKDKDKKDKDKKDKDKKDKDKKDKDKKDKDKKDQSTSSSPAPSKKPAASKAPSGKNEKKTDTKEDNSSARKKETNHLEVLE
ncbi:VanW family protein [[Clostridium] polysaccharolyticum]|uniref:Vancomycin resistance protein YoaR, contains peptidoglycan-binding and VanW domains n=1 Tax=[Clostridium] polysaccharolyticum TaxID=29364 RepID=A0A1I0E9A6_9FIRM|nr:VanW family protein [[Clostridium] polysaccharolyticum]SET41449.1 Vancomycin resistance protein YoaR, contains peptidoglycan-binding and VanW domains [[Clostridium] polysaccharolyticum]